MKVDDIKNQELHYINSLFTCRLEEAANSIENMDKILFHKMKEEISNIIDEESFEKIFILIDEYARALADISHIAGMRFMLNLLCCLKK